jgi:pilus assembly protein CpaB
VNRRALSIALVVALLGAGLLFLYLRSFERDASGGAPVAVLVVVKPIEPGATLTESMLAVRNVPTAYVETRAVRLSEKARVLGLRVAGRVQSQQTLMWTDLAIAADDRRDLSSFVEPGMRAVTVGTKNGGFNDRANELIRPGDRVDVIVTTGERDQETTVVLFQNVLVLAVGLDTGGEPGDKRSNAPRDSLLTLSLTIREAELEAMAAEDGRISVALRNPDDVRIVDGLPKLTSAALQDVRPRPGPVAAVEPLPASTSPVKLERADAPRGGRR